jgi:hypothetical protein
MPVVRPPILAQSEQYQSNFQVQAALADSGMSTAQMATAINSVLHFPRRLVCMPDFQCHDRLSV